MTNEGGFRVPSQYSRCHCHRCDRPPVADRKLGYWRGTRRVTRWWAYCAIHLAELGYSVMGDGVMWHTVEGARHEAEHPFD
jgi:hypothetical protein